MTRRKPYYTFTYGHLPTRDQFHHCWTLEVTDEECDRFAFRNDPRVGSCKLTEDQVWKELVKAEQEWAEGNDEAGEWCSSVLSVLGVEWV